MVAILLKNTRLTNNLCKSHKISRSEFSFCTLLLIQKTEAHIYKKFPKDRYHPLKVIHHVYLEVVLKCVLKGINTQLLVVGRELCLIILEFFL